MQRGARLRHARGGEAPRHSGEHGVECLRRLCDGKRVFRLLWWQFGYSGGGFILLQHILELELQAFPPLDSHAPH